MAKNQSTYTLKIDAELGNLQNILNTAKKSLEGFMASGNAPKGLEKAFEKINTLLGQISDKTGKPLDLKGLTGAGKDLNTVQENFRAIIRLLGEFDDLSDDLKLTFLSVEEQKKVTAITEALKAYGIAAEESAKKIKALEAAQKTLQKSEGGLGKARKKVGGIEAKKTSKEAELSGARGKLAAAQEAGADPEKIAQYQAKVTKLEADLTNLNSELAEANKELITAQSAYDAAARSVQTLGNEAKKASKDSLHKLKEDAKNLGISLEGLNGHDASKQIEILTDRLEEFRKEALKNGKSTFDSMNEGFTQAGKAAENMGEQVAEATESVKVMDEAAAQRDAFEAKIKSFLGLSGAAQVLRAALRDAMATITELDATMTEMAVVTDLTVGDYWDQLPEYSQRASELGVSINDAYRAATLYYQQGLKSNEVTAISAETLKLAKIAGIDAAEATDKMTAALRGFNMELNEASASKIADVYSELAAITAADVDEISTAMTKTASIASSAGMEFETTAAFLSQIIETTRESAETAGTAMKTVIARFQELKKDPSEIGEVEGEIVDANAIETALRSVGVSLRDASGQFRELDDVFLELSSKWDGLDKNTQRYIATIAAGSRQQSRFIAMMQDYGRTQELVTAANNSAGASQKQFEKTMDSLEAKVEKLKNAWHEFTMGIMNSDLVKFGVDALTKLLEVINKATSAFGGFAGSIAKISTVLTVFKAGKSLFAKIPENFKAAMVDVIKEAISGGEKAAEGASEGAQRKKEEILKSSQTGTSNLKEGYYRDKNGRIHGANGKFAKEEDAIEQSLKRNAFSTYVGKKIGLDKFKEGNQHAQKRKELKAELDGLEKDTEEYNKKQQEMLTEGKEQWNAYGEAIKQVGATITGTGIAFSMFGGILSSLGLEEAGNLFAIIGQGATLAGTAVSTFGPILAGIVAKLVAGGTAASAAWIWVTVIALAIAALITLIVIGFQAIKRNSPEGKLKKAKEASEAAAQAADEAAEAYENLKDSLNELDDGYKTLDNLRKGTKEWQEQVEKLNNSVMGLIEQYPELAALVQREGGILKLDVDSAEVQEVVQKYNKEAIVAKVNATNAKIAEKEAEKEVAYSKLGRKARISDADAYGDAEGNFSGNRRDRKKVRTEAIARALAEGLIVKSGGTFKATGNESKKKLKEMGIDPDALDQFDNEVYESADALREYGKTLTALDDEINMLYQTIASQAQALVDLTKYTEEETSQMQNIVTGERVKEYQDEMKAAQKAKSKAERKNAVEAYAKEKYGDNYKRQRASGKIVYYEDGKKRTKKWEELEEEMLESQFTTEAVAKRMEQIPSAIDSTMKTIVEAGRAAGKSLEDGAAAIDKAFADKDSLTRGEFDAFKEAMGEETIDQMHIFEFINQSEYGTYDEFAKAKGYTNYSNLDTAWQNLSQKQKDAFGSKEKYEEEFRKIVAANEEAWAKANDAAGQLTISLSENLSSGAAQAWTQNLLSLSQNGSDTGTLNTALTNMLDGLSAEQAEAAMAQINAIDKMDINAWENLAYTFENMGIKVATSELDAFVKAGIETAGAIRKIDFTDLHNQINDTYKLLEKVKQGGRKYSESDYKELIATNKSLEKNFTRIGDEFIYVGGSMKELTAALEKNSIAVLEEAQAQLSSKIEMAKLVDDVKGEKGYGSVSNMDEQMLYDYLTSMRSTFFGANEDIGGLGIEGLSNKTDFLSASKEDLRRWAEAIERLPGQLDTFIENYAKNLQEAIIQRYTHNEAIFNAEKAADLKSEYADEHQEALILQAIQSGGVSNTMIEAYRKAIADEDEKSIREIGKQIADATDKMIESNQGRDAYANLLERVADAIEDQYQKEIDALADIKESFISANDKIISKLQEQIDENRREREEEETKQNISDLYSQYAYMAMDTSGANSLEAQQLSQQIKDEEEAYQDALIDQAIQDLQSANEKAAEQRERQIALMEQQLQQNKESGWIAQEAKDAVDTSIAAINGGTGILQTEMGKILWGSEGSGKGLSELAKEDWASALQGDVASISNWLSGKAIPKVNVTGEAGLPNDEGGFTNTNAAVQNSAVTRAAQLGNQGGLTKQVKTSNEYLGAKAEFVNAGGLEGDFDHYVRNNYLSNSDNLNSGIDGEVFQNSRVMITGFNEGWGRGTVSINGEVIGQVAVPIGRNQSTYSLAKINPEYNGSTTGSQGQILMYQGEPYVHNGAAWVRIVGDHPNHQNFIDGYKNMKNKMSKLLAGYKTGGLADFTGPAWLDGTKSRPEYVLNAAQTERFFSLVDVLEGIDKGENSGKASGDNYFDINIQVDKLENDYDVEQVADKIRRMIYEDASYRNVNAINHIR